MSVSWQVAGGLAVPNWHRRTVNTLMHAASQSESQQEPRAALTISESHPNTSEQPPSSALQRLHVHVCVFTNPASFPLKQPLCPVTAREITLLFFFSQTTVSPGLCFHYMSNTREETQTSLPWSADVLTSKHFTLFRPRKVYPSPSLNRWPPHTRPKEDIMDRFY